jgi:tryptophan synthase alpha chain
MSSLSRISTRFAEVKKQKRAALIPFIMGGDPDMKTTAALLEALPEAGADMIEIGMPFSDPMADGPAIQAAGLRALKAGTTLHSILKLLQAFRKKDAKTPVILMGYYNPIYRYGAEKFCKDAAKAGADGMIIVDLPPEEEQEVKPFAEANQLHFIRLIAPTTDDKRLYGLMKTAGGFIYYISVTGITGSTSAGISEIKDHVIHLRRFTKLPIAVGFGIRTPEQAKKIGRFANAVVVGSALVNVIAKKKNKKAAVKAGADFVNQLAKTLK